MLVKVLSAPATWIEVPDGSSQEYIDSRVKLFHQQLAQKEKKYKFTPEEIKASKRYKKTTVSSHSISEFSFIGTCNGHTIY